MAKPSKKYWYRITVFECPLCCHEVTYRERVYDKKYAYQDRQYLAYHCGY